MVILNSSVSDTIFGMNHSAVKQSAASIYGRSIIIVVISLRLMLILSLAVNILLLWHLTLSAMLATGTNVY